MVNYCYSRKHILSYHNLISTQDTRNCKISTCPGGRMVWLKHKTYIAVLECPIITQLKSGG